MANDVTVIKVAEQVAPRCLTQEAGLKLLALMEPILKAGCVVCLDFQGITIFASLFFNNSVALLFKEFDVDFLESHVQVRNIVDPGRKAFSRSMENAKAFYSLAHEEKEIVSKIILGAAEE